ncbi:maleylacetoacetate isomerase [Celeribacter ethanolicus]|uniref:maleylacetoacetate isomerase n=1 Tax=Celeribacter ethanolicus TaxID=1758178 RepID=UPI00082CB423|nr:maleylacetoacetate isomerase [Celeribacter ethanolicus]
MSAETVLFDYWRSTASYRLRIALNLAGVAYRAVPVDLVAGEQRTAPHLTRNPQGLVPVLDIDGLRLTQSMAILDYLEDTGRLNLRPADPAVAVKMRGVVQAIACDLHPVCNQRVAAHVVELTGRGTDRAEWMRHFIRPGLVAVEAMLDAVGPYAMGERLSQADLVLIPQLYNAERWGVPTEDLPRLTRVAETCAGLPAFAAAHPDRVHPDRGA